MLSHRLSTMESKITICQSIYDFFTFRRINDKSLQNLNSGFGTYLFLECRFFADGHEKTLKQVSHVLSLSILFILFTWKKIFEPLWWCIIYVYVSVFHDFCIAFIKYCLLYTSDAADE